MNKSVKPLYDILKLNTRLCLNSIGGIRVEDLQKRPSEDTNSILFIFIHLVDARNYLLRMCGRKIEYPIKGLFADAKSNDDIDEYPSPEEVTESWEIVSENLQEALQEIDEEKLSQKSRFQFPVDDTTFLGAISFLTSHDTYHIGQIAYLRKLYGYGSMSYKE